MSMLALLQLDELLQTPKHACDRWLFSDLCLALAKGTYLGHLVSLPLASITAVQILMQFTPWSRQRCG
jgi:hypothetical protein